MSTIVVYSETEKPANRYPKGIVSPPPPRPPAPRAARGPGNPGAARAPRGPRPPAFCGPAAFRVDSPRRLVYKESPRGGRAARRGGGGDAVSRKGRAGGQR